MHMSGTAKGGQLAAQKNKKRYGKDFYMVAPVDLLQEKKVVKEQADTGLLADLYRGVELRIKRHLRLLTYKQ
jgi:hypothetical protein